MRFFAVFLLVVLTAATGGCARFLDSMTPEDTDNARLKSSDDLRKNGKFADALAGYRALLDQPPSLQIAAAARYSIALLHVLPDNPGRDYSQALAEFDEFIRLFPQHTRTDEARSWAALLKSALETQKENERLSKNIERLKQLDVKQEEKRLGR